MNPLRIGVVGLGVMGRNHLKALAMVEGVEVVAVADRRSEARESVEAAWRVWRDGIDVISEGELDAVVVATPTTTHFDLAHAALEAGLHVLLEKPMATNPEECDRLVELARRNDRRLMIGFVERFNPAMIAADAVVRSGVLGRLRRLHAARFSPNSARIVDVGVAFDTAIHDVDLLLHLAGAAPTRVTAVRAPATGNEQDLIAAFEFGDDLVAGLEASFLASHRRRELRIVGENGELVVDLLRRQAERYERHAGGIREHALDVPPGDALQAMHAEFRNAIRDGREPSVSGADGARAVRVVTRILAD